jgi:serine/threonine protein kinase
MSSPQTDRNLLFGILALQMDFIRREDLIAGMNAWAVDKDKPLGGILVEQGVLDPADHAALESMMERHIARHGDDPRKSLESLESVSSIRETLRGVGDFELQSTLAEYEAETIDAMARGTSGPGPKGVLTATGGRFRVLRLHDRGGLGEVFVARDEEIRREVAFKQIRSEYADNPDRRARFLLEAQITGGLEHPGIVPVYGLGHHSDGRPYYAMRFIRGDSLKEAIARYHFDSPESDEGKRSLELRKLLGRFLDVCNAVAYAHSRGILHRDLKPGNVMLGPYGETLVVDWGLAKARGPQGKDPGSDEESLVPEASGEVHATEQGSRVGTPAYMPPEQAAGRLDELGPESDVYSLGATLYALLTGQAAFSGPDVATILREVEKGDFPPPRKVKPGIDRALEAICLKAMSLRPKDRFPSPRGLAEDLQKWLADEPVSAWRETVSKRLGRWAKSHRTLVTSSAVGAIVALVAGGYLLYQARLSAEQRRTAANGRVDALTTAEVRALPLILEQLGLDRGLVRDRLEAIARGEGARPDDRRRLPAALALLPDDPVQADFLKSRALDPAATPEEVLVIRQALADRGSPPGGRSSSRPPASSPRRSACSSPTARSPSRGTGRSRSCWSSPTGARTRIGSRIWRPCSSRRARPRPASCSRSSMCRPTAPGRLAGSARSSRRLLGSTWSTRAGRAGSRRRSSSWAIRAPSGRSSPIATTRASAPS